jgi:tRNA splicing endonuclease
MNRDKLRRLEEIADKKGNPLYIMILRKEGKYYLYDKGKVKQELSAEELEQTKSSVIYLDEQDLKL